MTRRRASSLTLPSVLVLLLSTDCRIQAQGTTVDYERAATLRARTADKLVGGVRDPQWIDGGKKLCYRRELAGGRSEYLLVDCSSGDKSSLIDRERVARALQQESGRTVDPADLSIVSVALEKSLVYLLLEPGLKVCVYDRARRRASIESLEDAPMLHLEPRSDVVPSASGREDTELIFANGLEETLMIFWVNEGGKRSPYGEIAPGESKRQHTFAGHAWVLVDQDGKDRAAFVAEPTAKVAWVGPKTAVPKSGSSKPDEQGERRRRGRRGRRQDDSEQSSPDARTGLFLRDNNVWMRSAEGRERALTSDGTAEHYYGGHISRSPDGAKAVVMKTLAGEERSVHYVESSPRDQLQPRLHSYSYLKPGDRIDSTKPHLFDLESGREISIDDTLYPNPWSLRDVRWDADGRRFTFFYNQRGHQVLRIIAVDAGTGEARAIVDEVAKTFIDYSQKQTVDYLDATGEILWSSERDGWNHLYLYDARAGRVKRQLTRGEWVVRGVDRVDEETRQVWFRAGGVDPDQDPYHVHYCRVDLDSGKLVRLTDGDGTHSVSYSPDGEHFIDTYSRVDLPPITELRRASDGKLVSPLEETDITELLATGWRAPERFSAKGRDGKTDIWGIIRRPLNHDRSLIYPVIESIYAGPHGAFVPKSFGVHSSQAELAELGFIVVQIDGMGTNHRSKAFHDVCWQNLGDSGFPDRVLWIKAAAAKDPSMDLSRVGIYGGSAGGQSSLRALLAHGELYHAAVSDCGCHDNRMDKIWWNEAWMGWPLGPHYEEQSNVTQAHRLQGKLLLIVGEMDENVDPASTMQVVNALIRADKDFDLLVMPGVGHGSAESAYGKRRRRDFFVRNLLGVEPRGG